MRILSKRVDWKTKTLTVRLALEVDSDDCWNLFNLLSAGDLLKGSVYRYLVFAEPPRKIQKESYSGLVSNVKKKFDCILQIEVRFVFPTCSPLTSTRTLT